MLKKMALIAGLLSTGVASQAYAEDFVNLGPGGCRTPTGGMGTVTTYPNYTWAQCQSRCASTSGCKAIEYSIMADSSTSCEVHTSVINHTGNTDIRYDSATSCWLFTP